MKTRQSVLIAVMLLSCAAIAFAAPNFSGEWKMNSSKSDFGQWPPPSSIVQKITHEEPSIKVASAWSGDQGDMTMDLAYTTDGK
jgi:hypothetical protein